MAYSYNVYTGNGSTTQFTVGFPYVRREHVKVYVAYVDTAYTYVNNTTVQLATAPTAGQRVEVRRVTPVASVLVDFADGSTLVAADLDTSNLQHLYIEQELDDYSKQTISIDPATGLLTASGQRITNVASPVNAQDVATKTYVDTTTVASAGDAMTGPLAMGNNKITGLGTTSSPSDAASKQYVDDNALLYSGSPGFTQDGTGAVTRSWSSKLKDVVSVKDFGAVGDGVADDTVAIQAAITAASSVDGYGGKVYFPKGLYLVSSTLTLDSSNIRLEGAGTGVNHNTGGTEGQDGTSQIIGSHTSGPIIRIQKMGCGVSNLVISSTTARRNATVANGYGIWVEGPDTPDGNSSGPWRQIISNVHITKQPLHGLLMIANCIHSVIEETDIDNCKGHGIVIDGGAFTGRTNKARVGQINIDSVRISRTDGCALVIGDKATTTPQTLPYRIIVNNFECFLNLQNPATFNPSGNLGTISMFAENCEMYGSATGGDHTHNGIYILGIHNIIRNHRFINCEPYGAYIDDYGVSYRTTDITFDTFYVTNAMRGAGYYDPLVYAVANCRNINVYGRSYFSVIASLLNTSANLPGYSYNSAYVQAFSGVSRSTFNSWPTISLVDDAAVYLDLDTLLGNYGIISIASNIGGAKQAIVAFRVNASGFCSLLAGSSGVTCQTGALTGTTGVDGELTISALTTDNRLYLENRTASSRTYTLTMLSSAIIIKDIVYV